MYAWRLSAWWHHRQSHSPAVARWNSYLCSARAQWVRSTGRGRSHLCVSTGTTSQGFFFFWGEAILTDSCIKAPRGTPRRARVRTPTVSLAPYKFFFLKEKREWLIFDTETESHLKVPVFYPPFHGYFFKNSVTVTGKSTRNNHETWRPKLLWMFKNAPLDGFVDTYSTR